jgi:hypothetical protein
MTDYVIHVGDGHDARLEQDLLASQPARISAAIDALVMLTDDAGNRQWPRICTGRTAICLRSSRPDERPDFDTTSTGRRHQEVRVRGRYAVATS